MIASSLSAADRQALQAKDAFSKQKAYLRSEDTDTVLTQGWLRSNMLEKLHAAQAHVTYLFQRGKAAMPQPAAEEDKELLAGEGASPECKDL